MTEGAPQEPAEQKLARGINVMMLTVVCLLVLAASIWILVDRGPLARDILMIEPGEKPRHLGPYAGFGILAGAILLQLWVSVWRRWRSERAKQP